jgi:hypothetical protein
MGTVLVKDVLWRASVLLQDTAPQFQRWSERELVDWLNQGQAALAKFLPYVGARVDAIQLAAGSRQFLGSILAAACKPGDGSTPAAPIQGIRFTNPRRNMGANGTTPGRAVRMIDRDKMDAADPTWHTATGTEVRAVVFDPATPLHFYVWPAAANYWLEVAYDAMPVAIPNTATVDTRGRHTAGVYGIGQNSAQTITVGDENADELVMYVCARAHLKDDTYSESGKAAAFVSQFVGSLNARVQALTGRNPNLRMLPGIDEGAP